jgi:hypothetical protein
VSDSGGSCVAFWGGGAGAQSGWKEKAPRPMELELCSLPCLVCKQPKIYVFMFCIICIFKHPSSSTEHTYAHRCAEWKNLGV